MFFRGCDMLHLPFTLVPAVVMMNVGAAQVTATDLKQNLALLRENCCEMNGGWVGWLGAIIINIHSQPLWNLSSSRSGAADVQVLEHRWGGDSEDLLPRYDLIVACGELFLQLKDGILITTALNDGGSSSVQM